MVERSWGSGIVLDRVGVPDSSRVVSQAKGWTVCPVWERAGRAGPELGVKGWEQEKLQVDSPDDETLASRWLSQA